MKKLIVGSLLASLSFFTFSANTDLSGQEKLKDQYEKAKKELAVTLAATDITKEQRDKAKSQVALLYQSDKLNNLLFLKKYAIDKDSSFFSFQDSSLILDRIGTIYNGAFSSFVFKEYFDHDSAYYNYEKGKAALSKCLNNGDLVCFEFYYDVLMYVSADDQAETSSINTPEVQEKYFEYGEKHKLTSAQHYKYALYLGAKLFSPDPTKHPDFDRKQVRDKHLLEAANDVYKPALELVINLYNLNGISLTDEQAFTYMYMASYALPESFHSYAQAFVNTRDRLGDDVKSRSITTAKNALNKKGYNTSKPPEAAIRLSQEADNLMDKSKVLKY